MGKKEPGFIGDEEAHIRACLEGGPDQAPWLTLADWYDERGRNDAATMLRTHAAGFSALAEHLPRAWENFVREIARKGAYTWEAVCKEAGEALACAARAAGARPNPHEGRPMLSPGDIGAMTPNELRRLLTG